jgi:hypothetical protein
MDRCEAEIHLIYFVGDRPFHKLPFGPKCHELFVILSSNQSDDIFFAIDVYLKPKTSSEKYLEENIWTGPGLCTVIWTGSLTKTNRENINVKYNIP